MSLKTMLGDFLWIDALRDRPQTQARVVDPASEFPTLEAQLRALQSRARPWRPSSIKEALGVPAIQRAVTLICNTAGSLSMQGFRDGAAMDPTPALIARPDPYQTPRDFYRDCTYGLATRGETVLYIAAIDSQGRALSLVVVPHNELHIEQNPRNRLFPDYTWGDIKSTRFSAANPKGRFVHITYLREPGALHGLGPLQLAGAAVSVSVESQEFAANFYAEGGKPSVNLHSGVELEGEEANALREQWVTTPGNMPQITSGDLELREVKLNEQGGQMLMAREYQNGDAARMFGIPGSLMEYGSPGSSLTYQNLAEVWTQFVRGCLSVNYLVPIEQALTDLLPRTQVAYFDVDGLLRADIKTRYDVYSIGIDKGILTPEDAQRSEGLIPGSLDVAPVPAAPPAAVPLSLPQIRTIGPVRCDGTVLRRSRITTCNALLAEAGPFIGKCRRCHKQYEAA